MQKHEVAIVLINYNSNQDTIDAVRSIQLSEGINLPFIVVVDNNSKNKTIESDLNFYPDLKVIYNAENIGFGRANNLGIDWVFNNIISSYIFILNNDTIVQPGTIKTLMNGFDNADPNVAMTTPEILVYDNLDEIWYGGGDINYRRMTPTISAHISSTYTEFASGCAMFFKADALKSIKGFDPFFFMYDEDVELSIRLQQMGMKILYLPSSVIYHKCQGSQVKTDNVPSNQLDPKHPSLLFYLRNTIPNRKYIINKHLKGFDRISAHTYHSIYWLMKSAQYLLNGKTDAFYSVIRHLISKTKNQING